MVHQHRRSRSGHQIGAGEQRRRQGVSVESSDQQLNRGDYADSGCGRGLHAHTGRHRWHRFRDQQCHFVCSGGSAMKMRLVHCALALFLTAGPLPAALEFTLVPAVQSGAAGTEVTFSGTLTNNSDTDTLFLNDIQFSFNGAAATALTADSNVFFANVPGTLLPNETYTGPIFTITIDALADQIDYTG